MAFRSIKGTKDILPEDSPKWIYIEDTIRQLMIVFNYKEIRTPIFEETALFARSLGTLTNIVSKEMYTFLDRSDESLTLRPEMTAGVVRAYLQHNLGEQQPVTKVYYISPIFRQERPQAGRLRQFHQFGVESLGAPDAAVDAEVISIAVMLYKKLRIPNVELKINSVGCEKCRPPYKEVLKKYLSPLLDKLSAESQRRYDQNPLRILDSKDENDKALTKDAPLMLDHLCPECKSHFDSLCHNLKNLYIQFTIDGRIVRGLDYYTKTAFELISNDLGSQDALAGGGRYDLLTEQIGGKPTPGVGFAAGMERLLMVIEKHGIQSTITKPISLYIVALDDNARAWALRTAQDLRFNNISCEIDFLKRSIKAQMREADRQKAQYVLVVGSNELTSGRGKLKKMSDGSEAEISLSKIHTLLA